VNALSYKTNNHPLFTLLGVTMYEYFEDIYKKEKKHK